MTSQVKVTAHCAETIEVLCHKVDTSDPDAHLHSPAIEVVLQDGESTEMSVSGGQVVTVSERVRRAHG